jgi:hypothetical protein
MENATFCCLFHEITLSTLQDIEDLVSQHYGAKFQSFKISRSPVFKFIHDVTSGTVNDELHFEPSKYRGSLCSI